jgi:hypothetical protein
MNIPSLTALLLASAACGWSLPAQELDMIVAGQRYLMNGQWLEAYLSFDSLHRIDESDPAGYLFRAGALLANMIDSEDDLYGQTFNTLCDSVRDVSEIRLADCTPSDSALTYLYLGHQYAYRALYEARFASRLSALSYGIKAKNQYLKGLQCDSLLYDLYLGIGSYHYWKSVESGFLRFAGIFKDERTKGMAEVGLAIDRSLFSGEAAKSAMIWIMINEENYDSAVALSRAMLNDYPEGNNFVWPLAEAFFKSEKYQEAADMYQILLERLKRNPGNFFNVIEIIYRLKMTYDRLNEDDRSKTVIAYLKSVYDEIPGDIRRKQRHRLNSLLGRGR